MNLSQFLAVPIWVVLLKWTCLFALGWAVHGLLRHRHPRWRLILWRSILCICFVLPFQNYLPVPVVTIPLPNELENLPPQAPALVQVSTPSTVAIKALSPSAAVGGSSPAPISLPESRMVHHEIPWQSLFLAVWIAGGLVGILRLLHLQFQLFRLRQTTSQPDPKLCQLAGQIQQRLAVARPVLVRLSDEVTSPFVCGLWRPVIILPRALVQNLPAGEISALLSHEMAHLRQHDLIWCVAWRWMQTIFWFHPLIWPVPAAHNLACEQEADRIASGQQVNQASYAQLLARLALRVLALPAVETRLTLNGSSQIARRLEHLTKRSLAAWTWRHSLTGCGLVGGLFLLTAGCKVDQNASTGSPGEFKEMQVVVQDEDGKPVTGAKITPDGFRVKGIHHADAYGWRKDVFGPVVESITDAEGKASVKYPVMAIPEEKELTACVVFSVVHPDFVTVRPQEYSVDQPESPIRLTRGLHLAVSAYHGADHQPLSKISINLSGESVRPDQWHKMAKGPWFFNKLSPGGHLLQIYGQLESGELVYSDSLAFTAEKGGEYNFNVELKPGIRLAGRLDDQVPRPVKNGRVLIAVRPREFPANLPDDPNDPYQKYGDFRFWHSYRPIAEDGTFVFESVPAGEVDVIVHGDGFASKSHGELPSVSINTKTHTTNVTGNPNFTVPQSFVLTAPVTHIEIVTEPTATLEFMAKNWWGKPIPGATIWLNPNVVRMQVGIFGQLKQSSEALFHPLAPLPELRFTATTDQDGHAILRNLPSHAGGMNVEHPQYQVPLQNPYSHGSRDRYVRLQFSPGATNHFSMTLEAKGKDFIGRN